MQHLALQTSYNLFKLLQSLIRQKHGVIIHDLHTCADPSSLKNNAPQLVQACQRFDNDCQLAQLNPVLLIVLPQGFSMFFNRHMSGDWSQFRVPATVKKVNEKHQVVATQFEHLGYMSDLRHFRYTARELEMQVRLKS